MNSVLKMAWSNRGSFASHNKKSEGGWLVALVQLLTSIPRARALPFLPLLPFGLAFLVSRCQNGIYGSTWSVSVVCVREVGGDLKVRSTWSCTALATSSTTPTCTGESERDGLFQSFWWRRAQEIGFSTHKRMAAWSPNHQCCQSHKKKAFQSCYLGWSLHNSFAKSLLLRNSSN